MKTKDYEPIKFEIFQTDMEKTMYQLNEIIAGRVDIEQVTYIRDDFQHKIECHKDRGEWI